MQNPASKTGGLHRQACLAATAICLGVCLAAMGGTRTWTGAVDQDWFTGGNWTPAGVPDDGDAVIVDAGSAPNNAVLLSADSAALASVTVSGATVTFTNWNTRLMATNVTIGDGGILTLPGPFTESDMSNRVHVVCETFELEPGGLIDVDGKGFAQDNGEGKGGIDGHTLSGGGGGYGGRGGRGSRAAGGAPGIVYGNANAPEAPGSGGGGITLSSGAGGGAVRIDASDGVVILNGTISANGGSGNAGGSGGSIFITCGTLSDSTNGLIRVNGGAGPEGGGGGGGRIALSYAHLIDSDGIRFAASPGSGYWSEPLWWLMAQWGTLHLSDSALLSETLSDHRFTQVRLSIDAFDAWAVDTLSVSHCSLDIAIEGFQLTVSNTLAIGEGGILGLGVESATAAIRLLCGGDVVLSDGGVLRIFSGETETERDHGALIHVAGDLRIGAGSWIHPYSHPLNGGSPLFQARDVEIVSGGGFDAVGRGYQFGQGDGKGSGTSRGSGGGYGGKGGISQFENPGGNPYGSATAPLDPGSGSAVYIGSGSYGGGLVRIEAERAVRNNGTISAAGGAFSIWHGGAGSGGGIAIHCMLLEGNGLLDASGGNASSLSGGGGGGRIAVIAQSDRLTGESPGTYEEYAGSANGRVLVNGGTGYEAGTAGTFHLDTPQGTILFVR